MTWRSLGMALMLGAATVVSTGCTKFNMRPLSFAAKNPDADPIAAKVAFARLCERHGQGEQARQTYQSLLKLDPRMQAPLHRLAVMSAKQGKFEEADEYFEKALAVGAPSAELLSDHGYCLYLEDRLDDAERVLRDAAKLDPRYKAAKVNLGLVLGQQERLGESYAAFKDAVGEAQALANMAYVQAQRNDFQQAETLYSRALSTDPELRSAAIALVQLNDIKKRQQSQSGVQQAKLNEPIAARQPNSAVAEDDRMESRRPQPMADVAARNMPRPTETQVQPAIAANKPADAPLVEPGETSSSSFVPRQRINPMGQNWGTGETQQPNPVNVSVANSARQLQPASELNHEVSPSKPTSTSSPIQITTRSAENGTSNGTAKMTVTTPSSGPAVSSGPAAQSSAASSNPQVLDMSRFRNTAAMPTRTGEDEAPVSISLLKKPLSADKNGNQLTTSAESANLSASPTVQSAPQVKLVTPKAPKTKSMTSTVSKTTTPPQDTLADRATLPSQPRAPLTPPAPPARPSGKSKTTEFTPVSTQTSTSTNSGSPAAVRSSKPTTASGANAPARLDPTGRKPMQPASQPTGANAPNRSKAADGKTLETPAKAVNSSNGSPSPRSSTMQSDSSEVRYVDYRDPLTTATQTSAQVQPAIGSDKLNYGPSATPGVMPSGYPTTDNPGSSLPNGRSLQGARVLTPTSPSAAAFNPQQPRQPSADAVSVPGFAAASDSP